ncbi:conserved hypothetical protein [Pyrenophora tritici-repentis Pt-1C-BFP]|uniref:Uncharacterized protein n=1 Tax=Pyrenophora tritici-repentis (strain Pt-1C-BFP) TaxID=426418 RepID=B2W2U0_PYRTR|nr:uncharacterized protein PTRG_03738 [Pyrenophora tritici-repentis Pt-1C-BFP]EDU46576.1 conserved hypothetical protein [Pyrenophora tritici-repentis Pt-1C-BFP]
MAVAMTTFLQGAITIMSSFAAKDLGMSTAEVSWMNSGTSLTSGALLLFFGSIADLFGRKSMFIGSMFMFAVVSLGAGFSKTGDTIPKQTFNKQALKKLDLPGTLLTMAGVGMFCAALSLGGDAPQGWKTPYVLVLLIIGILLIAAFVVWEIKYEHAMIDMKIWLDKDFSLLFVIISFGFLGFPVFNFWIALYFQVELHMNAILTGVHMLPMVVCGLTANFTAAAVQHRVSNKLLTGTGAAALVISFTVAAVQRTGDSYWAFSFPALCLCVIGVDFQFIVANMYVLSSMPLNKQSIAGSLLQTVTRLATSVGYGVATAIFDAVKKSPATSGYYANNAIQPYAAVFWFAAASAVPGLLLVPFLKVGTQGHAGDTGRVRRRASDRSEGEESAVESSHVGSADDGGEKGTGVRQNVSTGV